MRAERAGVGATVGVQSRDLWARSRALVAHLARKMWSEESMKNIAKTLKYSKNDALNTNAEK